jgi:hypothetical protein
VGTVTNSYTGTQTPTTSTAIVVDGRTAADRTLEADIPGTTAPDCEALTGSPQGQLDPIHELIVNDAQP